MKNIKYFLFSMLCIFVSSIVFAKDEITIEKMIPVYDENSGVIVSEENGIHSVVFNDKDQNVKYNIILKNNTKRDISLKDIVLPESPEEFFKYEFVGIDENTILEPNSTEEVVLSLETVKTEGWGRNFTLDLTSKVEIMDNVVNPNTSAQELIVLFVSITFIICIVTICLKNKKVSRYVVLVVMFGSLMSVTYAKDPIILPIKLNVSFESKNIMKSCSCVFDDELGATDCTDFWEYEYVSKIKNVYIENEFKDIAEYEHKFDMSHDGDSKVIAYLLQNEEDSNYYDLHFQADGIIYPNNNASGYFARMFKIEKIHNLAGLDTSNVTNMNYMFAGIGWYSDTLDLDLSDLDTSNVTDMSYMFNYTGHQSTTLTLDLSNLDTSNVTNMNGMFLYAGTGSTNFTLDVSNFDTSKVTDMSWMFYSAGYQSTNLTLDLSNFDTSNVTDMSYMFWTTGHNSTSFILDVSNFNTSNVTDMEGMFNDAGYSDPNFTLDVSNFDTSNVTDMSHMFSHTGYNSLIFSLDVSGFDTSNVTDMSRMFVEAGYSNPNFALDVSNFDTSKVTRMSSMFSNTGYSSMIFKLDLSNFDTSNVTDMGDMFYKAGYNNPNFTLDVSNFDTSNVTNMSHMFYGTGYNSLVFKLDLSNFDTSNVTDMGDMFYKAGYNNPNFTLDVSNFDTSNVTNMSHMFYGTGYNSLVFTLDVSNFDTSNVTDMRSMFESAGYNSKIFDIDTSNFDMSKVKKVIYMFNGAGYNSTKLNTSITINKNNYSKYDYTNVFKNVAIKPGTNITVNYTSETSDLVDQMIATKSSGANVVKGVQVD